MTEIIIVTRRERQTHFEGACPECGSVMIDELTLFVFNIKKGVLD